MKNTKLDTGIGSLQWFIFLLANSLTIPIIVGQVFQLSPVEISGLMQRTFLVVGVSSLLSGWLGHRLPIPDGPAGIWLGVFILMGQMAVAQGLDNEWLPTIIGRCHAPNWGLSYYHWFNRLDE